MIKNEINIIENKKSYAKLNHVNIINTIKANEINKSNFSLDYKKKNDSKIYKNSQNNYSVKSVENKIDNQQTNNLNNITYNDNPLINQDKIIDFEKYNPRKFLDDSLSNILFNKDEHKLALINGKIIDYNTLINIQINKYKDNNPVYKNIFNNEDNSIIDKSLFDGLMWDNHTYTKYLFYLNYVLKYQEELYYQYNKAFW